MNLSSNLVKAAMAATLVQLVVVINGTPAVADSIRQREWFLNALQVDRVHQITEGAGVVVGLVDSGVNAQHQDLQGAILSGTAIDVTVPDDGRRDPDGHGTEMAGIIAGRGHGSNNGVLGIAPQSKILPIRAPTNGLNASQFMTGAVDFAIAHHVGVLNMSFGFVDAATRKAAIHKAAAADIVLVAAAGNTDGPANGALCPGLYPEVLAVGAYDSRGQIAPYSVRGPQVRISAPGSEILTTGNRGANDYYDGDGTSEATAMVSGAAALLRAKFPRLSAAEIVHRLTATADDAGPRGRDDAYGYGRLNILKALTADVTPLTAGGDGASSHPAGRATGLGVPVKLQTAESPLLPLVVLSVGVLVVLAGVIVGVVFAVRRPRRGAGRNQTW